MADFTIKDLSNLEKRKELASSPSSWKSVMELPLNQAKPLATNLSACMEAGDCAYNAGVVDWLFSLWKPDMETSDDTAIQISKMFWQVICNLTTGLSDCTVMLTPEMACAVEKCVSSTNSDIKDKCWFWLELVASRTCLTKPFIDILTKCGTHSDAAVVLSNCADDIDVDLMCNLPSQLLLQTLHIVQKDDSPQSVARFAPGIQRRLETELTNIENELCSKPEVELETNNSEITSLLESAAFIATDSGYDFSPLLPLLIELLKTSHKKLPRIQLKEFNESNDMLSYKSLKTAILSLVSAIVAVNDASRDTVRELEGLAAILDCCVIDARNPFMKERAVLCLRYLLQNEKNKEYIDQLKPQGVDERTK